MKKLFKFLIVLLISPFALHGMITTPKEKPILKTVTGFDDAQFMSAGILAYLKFKNADDFIITGVSICKGSTTVIKAAPQDAYENDITSGLTYEWHDGLYPNLISTNSSITINSDTIIGSKLYRLIVTQGGKSAEKLISVRITDKVIGWIGPTPLITCDGVPIKIESFRPSLETILEWYKNDTLLAGESNHFITVTQGGVYQVKMTDPNCSVPDTTFDRYLKHYTSLDIEIESMFNDTTICNGNEIKLRTISGQNKQIPFDYQWQKNGEDILGKNSSEFIVNQPGKYRIKSTQGACVSYSKEIKIVESDKLQKPKVYSPLSSICNLNVRLNSGFINAKGDFISTPGGKWYQNNLPVSVSSNATLFWTSSGGWYKIVRGEGTSCEVSSDSIFISKNGNTGKPKVKLIGYKNTILCESGDSQLFEVDFSEIIISTPVDFQWKKDGIDIPWATSFYLSTNTTGIYQVEISNEFCNLISDPIIISSEPAYKPKINYSESSLYCDSNRLIRLTGDELPFYKDFTWYRNGEPVSDPYHYRDLYINQPGDYYFKVENNNCIGVSDTITILSGPNNDFLIEKPSASYKNESAKISIQSCGGDVKWYETETAPDPFFIGKTYSTPALINNVSYWVSCTEEYCESDRVQVNIVVENCTEKIIHNGVVEDRIYKASQSIESSSNLPSGVIYDAGKSIILLPGFSAGSNEVFEARIGWCE